ncbi:phytanoyl-CoA dioxygenase family protein [Paenibacillus piri]|uniref:Phytanoyl-CoA dioxygenase family protein n=1 Tax=Paenibacillus piri TaxID=2547395 RepID=A0A4V2ZSB3_9BACL|nr:phytanoyl-CoA dioxygenase family protein [Paenibacillus piri]TDF92504.1 hypothetical protein E1757_29380 [Paenibacillus piri]
MDAACLQYGLTEEERRTFNETGYLIVENALAPEQVAAMTREVDRIYEQKLNEGHDASKAMFYTDFIKDHPLFLDLVDYGKILPKVWGILGWNIYMYHTHMIVTPPSGQAKSDKSFGWHQDSGRANREMESPRPRLSLKVAYFLSDLSVPDRGNFWIVPNSHLQDTMPLSADGQGQPAGAIPVCVKPGTAVFFDRRLWHAASPNWSDVTRKVVFYGYGYRWIRRKDDMTMVDRLLEQAGPIRRQMLGDGTSCNGYYTPTDEDVPLREWLKEQGLPV